MSARERPPAYLPDETQELLLRAALDDGDEVRSAWNGWRRRVDLEDVGTASARMLPLAYRNLIRLGIDDPEIGRLKGAYRQNWARNQLLFRDTAAFLRSLHAAGVPTLVLKGVALASLDYGDPGVRPMADADVLVPFGDAIRAFSMLERDGWIAEQGPPERLITLTHAALFRAANGRRVELHWYSMPQIARDDDFWAAAVPVEIAGVDTRALGPADQLVHVCVHGADWASTHRLQWVADAITVIRSSGSALDWDRVVERAETRKLSSYLTAALRYLRESFDAPVAAETIDALAATPRPWYEKVGYRGWLSSSVPVRTVRVSLERQRRLSRVTPAGSRPPSFVSVSRSIWGLSHSRRALAGKAVASVAKDLARRVRRSSLQPD